MKLPVSPSVELFRWGPIKLRVLYMAYFMEAIWHEVPKHYPWPWPPIVFAFKKGEGVGMIEYKALRAVGAKYFKKYLLSKENFSNHWNAYKQWVKSYQVFASQVEAIKIKKLPTAVLAELYIEFRKLNKSFWVIAHVPEAANLGGEAMLLHELRKVDALRAEEYLEVLAAPTKPSFFQEEEIELLRAAKSKTGPPLKSALQVHAKHYGWLLNSYAGNQRLSPSFFRSKLQELTRDSTPALVLRKIEKQLQSTRERKKSLMRKLRLSNGVRDMANMLSESIYWQDHRKSYIWRLQHTGDPILTELARRHGWKLEKLLLCLPREVIRLASGRALNRQKVLQRGKDYVMVYTKRVDHEYYGATARRIYSMYGPKVISSSELRGLVVSRASKPVIGSVRVIRDPLREVNSMGKGEVLVATMTSPEYIVAMRKAAAIVTDEGGMTAHAAIVSRELGIPCIVRTGTATQVLKNGDVVEVDTKQGVVRIVSRR